MAKLLHDEYDMYAKNKITDGRGERMDSSMRPMFEALAAHVIESKAPRKTKP
jgi:hypothetical protein